MRTIAKLGLGIALIDSSYPTLADRRHTAVMGSSMGGLMSLYLSCSEI
ncbi:MAG: hypothetical protein K2K97_05155 [Muribaculaceae bacterium]|nr:hypothetical protein [Muribaculaceae bacterium]